MSTKTTQYSGTPGGTTGNVTPVDYVQGGTIEKGKVSEISPNEVLAILNIPPLAHEIAVILRFGISYAKHQQFDYD